MAKSKVTVREFDEPEVQRRVPKAPPPETEGDEFDAAVAAATTASPPAPEPKIRGPRPKTPALTVKQATLPSRGYETEGRPTKRQLAAVQQYQSNPAAFWDERMSLASQETGKKQVVVPIREDDIPPVIPFPSLAVEHVLGVSGWPLGTYAVQLAGREGCGKTAFLLELIRLAAMVGGGGRFFDHESKATVVFLKLMLEQYYHRLKGAKCRNIEAWQTALTRDLKEVKSKILGTKEAPGPGKIFPMIWGVDSVMGKSTEGSQERVHKEGHGAKSYPDAAAVMTDYLKTIINEFEEWPFSLVFVNHSKESIGEDKARTTPGSRQLRHQLGLDLEFTATQTKETATFRYVPVRLRSYKNTVGPTHNWCRARLCSWDVVDKETDKTQKVMRWDWAHSDIDFLLGKTESPIVKHALKEAGFHLEAVTSGSVYRVWSKTLGISKKEPLEAAEAHDLLHNNLPLKNHLRAYLGIQTWPILAGAIPFIEKAKAK